MAIETDETEIGITTGKISSVIDDPPVARAEREEEHLDLAAEIGIGKAMAMDHDQQHTTKIIMLKHHPPLPPTTITIIIMME